jgi:hypothetical protein
MAADITIIVNRNLAETLARSYSGFAAYTKQLSEDLVKEEGALTCREAIIYSPPLDGASGGKGDKKPAERWGNWAVANDIMRVVTEDSKSAAVAVNARTSAFDKYVAWRAGKPPKSNGLMYELWKDTNVRRSFARAKSLLRKWNGSRNHQVLNEPSLEARHNRIRKLYKGRIGKNTKGKQLMGQSEPYAFASASVIKNYIKKRQQRVGWMKAGWGSAIHKIGAPKINGIDKRFGLRKLPAWITRHPARHGFVSLNKYQTFSNNVLMTVRNDLGDIFGVSYLAGTRRYVMGVRAGKLQRRGNHFMRAAIAKANAGGIPN